MKAGMTDRLWSFGELRSHQCLAARLSAVGELQACLAYDDGCDLRAILRAGGTDDDLVQAIRSAVGLKRDGHVFLITGQGGPKKQMVSIGG